MTYEEYKEFRKEPKYFGLKCFISGCDNFAEYEIGDARYRCGGCEKHAHIYEDWASFNKIKYGHAPSPQEKVDYQRFNF
jgi:hypothetical protein